MDARIGAKWKHAHAWRGSNPYCAAMQAPQICLKANWLASQRTALRQRNSNFIIAAREQASLALLTRLGCDRLSGLLRQT
jgi:hypothetical protein